MDRPLLTLPRLIGTVAVFLAVSNPSGVAFGQATIPEQTEEQIIREARRAELDAVARDIEITKARQAELKREIESLDKDRATLNQTLIDTGKRVQKLESDVDRAEQRMRALINGEQAVRASLAERRGVLAEVLAALQRIGHRPPPALLVRPEDALASVRSAILLGAVVPDLRVAADKLTEDLQRLVALREEKERERDRMQADANILAEERARVALLIEEKKKQRAVSLEALADEDRRASVLAEQATTLKELIARMESESTAAAEASRQAEKAAAAARAAQDGKPATSLGRADRLAPTVAFAEAKGLLPVPVSGKQIKGFGADDGLGGTTEGLTIATRPGAQVSAPNDGWVVFAGDFRSYGKLLIINAGDGYHVLLAGMDRIDVQLGQFVLAGEPVAVMASQRLASAVTPDVGVKQPVLYVEFRKDGNSIDPAPWWAASNIEKVGG